MRVIVCGSREWTNYGALRVTLDGLYFRYGKELEVVEGCAPGADTMAETWCANNGIEPHHFPARWDAYPKHLRWRAGHDRNEEMLQFLLKHDGPIAVFAFKDNFAGLGKRGGTEDMCTRAHKAGVPVVLTSMPNIPQQHALEV